MDHYHRILTRTLMGDSVAEAFRDEGVTTDEQIFNFRRFADVEIERCVEERAHRTLFWNRSTKIAELWYNLYLDHPDGYAYLLDASDPDWRARIDNPYVPVTPRLKPMLDEYVDYHMTHASDHVKCENWRVEIWGPRLNKLFAATVKGGPAYLSQHLKTAIDDMDEEHNREVVSKTKKETGWQHLLNFLAENSP